MKVLVFGAHPVENVIGILVDHKGTLHIFQDFAGLFHSRAVIIGKSCIEGFSAQNRLMKSSHEFMT